MSAVDDAANVMIRRRQTEPVVFPLLINGKDALTTVPGS
jgi:hypothetical protein